MIVRVSKDRIYYEDLTTSAPPTQTVQRSATASVDLDYADRLLPARGYFAHNRDLDWVIAARQAVRAEPLIAELSNPDDVSLLLVLLCFLDISSIRRSVLVRGGTSRGCWNELGEVEEVWPSHSGLNPGLVEMMSDTVRLTAAVEVLVAACLLHASANSDELSISTQTRDRIFERLDDDIQRHWRYQALFLVCHGFPREHYLEPR